MEYTTSADGTRIAYERRGDGPPLLLVHGTTADHTSWEPVCPALEERFSLYLMDRRGRGESGDAADYSIEREFEDIAAVAGASDEPVSLAGHSYGALCSLGALRRVDDLRRVVLYEPPFRTGAQAGPPDDLVERMAELAARGDEEAVLETFFGDVLGNEDRLELYRSQPSWPMRLDAAPTVPREFRATWAFRPAPGAFEDATTPALVVLGGATDGPLEGGTRAVHERLPKSELAVLEGEGHGAVYTAPDRLADEFVSFLA